MITLGIIYHLLYVLRWTLKWLGSYHKTSKYLVNIKSWIKAGFQLIHVSEIDIQKKYWQYSLLWLSLDFLLLTPMFFKLVNKDSEFPIMIGGLIFIIALYLFIRKSTFEGVKHKMNEVAKKLYWPTAFFMVGTFVSSSMKVSDIDNGSYSYLSENTKLFFLNLTFGIFFSVTCVLGLFLIISQTIKYIVAANFYASELICVGIKRVAGYCLKKEPEEPYKILELWVDPLKYLLKIVWLSIGVYVLKYFCIHFFWQNLSDLFDIT